MMTEAQRAKNTSKQQLQNLPMDVVHASEPASVAYVGNQVTRAPHAHEGVIFVGKKGKKQNAQTVASVVTGRTHAITLRLFCMLKMLLQSSMRSASDPVTMKNL
ncbi:hypothetical protein ACQJBY_038339 [Aegilops geniculata]